MKDSEQCINIRDYLNSQEIIRDIREHRLTPEEARSAYYRCVTKEESKKISMLSKISPDMDMDKSIEKSLHEIKQREQFRLKLEIFRRECLIYIEKIILGCIRFDRISTREIEETETSIENIKNDLLGKSKEYFLIFSNSHMQDPASAYYNLMKDYARRGISDLLCLSTMLYEKKKNCPLTFNKIGMLDLCNVWLSVITDYRLYYDEFMSACHENEKFITSLLKGKMGKTRNTFEKDKIIKELIINREKNEREQIIDELTSQALLMASKRKQLKKQFSFMLSYYNESLERYRDVQQYLFDNICNKGEFHPKSSNTRMIFVSFTVILHDLKQQHSRHIEKGYADFGPAGYSYMDITYRLLLTVEVLHSVFLQMSKISITPSLSKEYDITEKDTAVLFNGERKRIPMTSIRDYCRNKIDELTDEIQIFRSGIR